MIPIRNIYYMLAYAFVQLRGDAYHRCATESFAHAQELLASILAKGVALQLKQGLARDYRPMEESTSCPRGRLLMGESLRSLSLRRGELVCAFDAYDENCFPNQVLKATMLLLLRQDLRSDLHRELRRLLRFFRRVDTLPPSALRGRQLATRSSASYCLLLNMCQLIWEGLLPSGQDGELRLQRYLDDQKMHRLYEKFILNFFRQEHPELHAESAHIRWMITAERPDQLPVMHADVILHAGQRTLIIDAKFYQKNLQRYRGGRGTIHSAHLYQLYTYVDNYRRRYPERQVSGMLLYAQTDAEQQPQARMELGGFSLAVQTLDLNRDFACIAGQLHAIAAALTEG
ncbi:MAG: 5-methylcytosine-specific restriction endonuclease system specificity protein McrC [Akkermansia sp.]